MNFFKRFIAKVPKEYTAIAESLAILGVGIALDPKDKAKLDKGIDLLQSAAGKIERAVDDTPDDLGDDIKTYIREEIVRQLKA